MPPLSIRLQKVEFRVMVERELDYTEYHLSDLPRTRINFWWKKKFCGKFSEKWICLYRGKTVFLNKRY